MSDKNLSTDSYKGVRDFYPEDMAIQRYIFDTWAKTAESFGFERYDASILEPSDLYKAKGAENEEMVNEQTYTFIDRGEREVTLRPEMTPTVARMVAGRRRELSFPVRWYSIPNLFRYERPQRGRLREHWQLNCDIFGADDYTADVEIIALAYQTLINFGAKPELFEIRINNRAEMSELLNTMGIIDVEQQSKIVRLNDRYHKITGAEYQAELRTIVNEAAVNKVVALIESQEVEESESTESGRMARALANLGIRNVKIDRTLARGFDYYTGTIFEIFDVSGENNRSMLGGGRYDNLTGMFGGEPISGIGFGMGDVTMRDFLETHNLLEGHLQHTKIMIVPMDESFNLEALKMAQAFRQAGIACTTDNSARKLPKKLEALEKKSVTAYMVVGENEMAAQAFTLKSKANSEPISGTLEEIIASMKKTSPSNNSTQ